MKPIIFSTPMVQAILDDRKTMTRRVIKPQPYYFYNCVIGELRPDRASRYGAVMPDKTDRWIAPPYQPDDILWVREKWRCPSGHRFGCDVKIMFPDADDFHIVQLDDLTEFDEWREKWMSRKGWIPSIHMPKKAARNFLRVTDVRVERVKDIAKQDVIREGVCNEFCAACLEESGGDCKPRRDVDLFCGEEDSLVDAFADLWDRLNAERGYSWEVNPWVWVITFERISHEEAYATSGLVKLPEGTSGTERSARCRI